MKALDYIRSPSEMQIETGPGLDAQRILITEYVRAKTFIAFRNLGNVLGFDHRFLHLFLLPHNAPRAVRTQVARNQARDRTEDFGAPHERFGINQFSAPLAVFLVGQLFA